MKIQIVGGNFEKETIKASGVVIKLFDAFYYINSPLVEFSYLNGGYIENLPESVDGDLSIWMPNISNEESKHYPKKKIGSVLICSKLMHEGVTVVDAVSRIFKMHANAVICIYPDGKYYRFELRDALNNVWYKGADINKLALSILYFYGFTKSAKRVQTKQNNFSEKHYKQQYNVCKKDLQKLIDINKKLQYHIKTKCGDRFFGNISTRCQKLFPSLIKGLVLFVSPRNSDKESLTPEEMVWYFNDTYYGKRKPSVDSPTQLRIYKNMDNIKYMIHGHATFIHPDIKTTNNYCLCGDINEVDEVVNLVGKNEYAFCINLKNHGFLIGADTLKHLEGIVDNIIDNQEVKIEITNSNG